jgi:hypothetical protein
MRTHRPTSDADLLVVCLKAPTHAKPLHQLAERLTVNRAPTSTALVVDNRLF